MTRATHSLTLSPSALADIEARVIDEFSQNPDVTVRAIHLPYQLDVGPGFIRFHTTTRAPLGTNHICLPTPYVNSRGAWAIHTGRVLIQPLNVRSSFEWGGKTSINDPWSLTRFDVEVHFTPDGPDTSSYWQDRVAQRTQERGRTWRQRLAELIR